MSQKHQKVCMALNYIEQSLVLDFAFPGSVSISDFASLVGIPIDIGCYPVGLK